jgi:hypothetical protein
MLLALAHWTWLKASWAGMEFAYAAEGTDGVAQAREVRRAAWRNLESAVELMPMLYRGAVGLYVAAAACAALAAWRYRPAHGSWVWVDAAALLLVVVNVYVAALLFAPSLRIAGFMAAILAAAISAISVRRHKTRSESAAMATGTLTVALLTLAAQLASHFL